MTVSLVAGATRPSYLAGAAVVAAAAVVLLVGCKDSLQPPREFDYGFLSLSAARDSDGVVVGTPVGIFYRSTQLVLPTSHVTADSCAIRPTPSGSSDTVPHVPAGDSLTLELGGATTYLKPRLQDRLTLYLLPQDSLLRIEPGTTVTFTIPGASGGFPAATASIAAPEPFVLSAIPTAPPMGQPVTVTWTPAGDADSRLLLFLQYATVSSATLNQMVLCSLKDDGAHTIPAALLTGWRSAFNGRREIWAIRERIAFQDLGQAKLHVTSAFRVIIPNP